MISKKKDILQLLNSDLNESSTKIEPLTDEISKSVLFIQDTIEGNFNESLKLLKTRYGKEYLIKLFNRKNNASKEDFIKIIINLGEIEKADSEFIENIGIDIISSWSNILEKTAFIVSCILKIDVLKYLSFDGAFNSIEKDLLYILYNSDESYLIKNLPKYYLELKNTKLNKKYSLNYLIKNLLNLNKEFIDYFGLDFFIKIEGYRITRILKLDLDSVKANVNLIKEELNLEKYSITNITKLFHKKINNLKKGKGNEEEIEELIKKLAVEKSLNSSEGKTKIVSENEEKNIPNIKRKKFKLIKINEDFPLDPKLGIKFDKIIDDFSIDYKGLDKDNQQDDFGNNILINGELRDWKVLYAFIFHLVDIINKSNNKKDIEKIPEIILNLNKIKFQEGSKTLGYIHMLRKHYKTRINTF